MKKILILPPHPWYMEAQAEYLIRYLSDEFFMEIAPIPYPPYETYLDRFPNESPFMRNPDDYDLIWPLWPGHWGVDKEKYHKKMAIVFYEPNESRKDVAVIGATTPQSEASLEGIPHYKLRFGIDTELFKPLPWVRENGLLRVGIVGTLYNPRRMVKDLVPVLKDIPGVKLMLFPSMAPRDKKELDDIGGDLKSIVSGNKWFNGLPNVYNSIDVLIRCEQDPGYSFPVLEAAACGVPVIATDMGIDHYITNAGGGYLIPGDRVFHMNHPQETVKAVKEAVLLMRDNPGKRREMGKNARLEIEKNWTWDKHINNWRLFFREGVQHASNE